MRRPIAYLYSVTNLLAFKPLVESTMQFFFSRLDGLYCGKKDTVKLCDWMQLFTFDVIGDVTFSRRLGFLETGGDIKGVMESNWEYFKTVAPVRLP